MLNNAIRILNFDNSVTKQQKLLSKFKADIVNLTRFGPKARYCMGKRTYDELYSEIGGTSKDSVTFLGSGDFHHISSLLISRYDEPITVIDFDLHPDWDILSFSLNCGSWVNRALENKNVQKFILAGVSSNDISTFSLERANLASLKDNRVEIYPHSHEPSLVFFRKVPENISIKIRAGLFYNKIWWTSLKGLDMKSAFLNILKRLPSKKVYISIDKDCLKNEYALTNWEEGLFSLDELLSLIKLIKENSDIVGTDITGDYSEILVEGKIKSLMSHLDHPKHIKASRLSRETITAVNEATNIKLAELLSS
jgi:hypothetical protein